MNEQFMLYDHHLDVKGALCPIPVIKAKKVLAKMSNGQRLLVETSDPVAQLDIPHMCQQFGFTLLEVEEVGGGHTFLVQK